MGEEREGEGEALRAEMILVYLDLSCLSVDLLQGLLFG
jgi:hypothetical protein